MDHHHGLYQPFTLEACHIKGQPFLLNGDKGMLLFLHECVHTLPLWFSNVSFPMCKCSHLSFMLLNVFSPFLSTVLMLVECFLPFCLWYLSLLSWPLLCSKLMMRAGQLLKHLFVSDVDWPGHWELFRIADTNLVTQNYSEMLVMMFTTHVSCHIIKSTT